MMSGRKDDVVALTSSGMLYVREHDMVVLE
jgi:hypothetical protein